MNTWETKKVLMLVKTYPSPSKKYQEVTCTAGITSAGELIRLYPIRFRYLKDDQKFEKYRWIEADVKKNEMDARPESYKVNYDTIKLLERLDAKKDYLERRKWITPLLSNSIDEIYDNHRENGVSLGIFRPKFVSDIIVKETKNKEWTQEELTVLTQISIEDKDVMPLEKIPYDFSFRFVCDTPNCNGHEMKNTDWELSQTYRNFIRKYGREEGLLKTKEKWLGMFSDINTDTYLIVGSVHRWKKFIIIGYVNLKKEGDVQLSLFD